MNNISDPSQPPRVNKITKILQRKSAIQYLLPCRDLAHSQVHEIWQFSKIGAAGLCTHFYECLLGAFRQ